jgi:hypothetical protein
MGETYVCSEREYEYRPSREQWDNINAIVTESKHVSGADWCVMSEVV